MDDSLTPHCKCGGFSGTRDVGNVVTKEEKCSTATINSTVSESADVDPMKQPCVPGKYWCEQTKFAWILVCNSAGQWARSANCGKTSEGYGWYIISVPRFPMTVALNKSHANDQYSCRSSSIPSGYAACNCRSLPGGPPALDKDAARSTDTTD